MITIKGRFPAFLTVFTLPFFYGLGNPPMPDKFSSMLPDTLNIQYGKDQIQMVKTSREFDIQSQKSTSSYFANSLPELKIELISEVSYLNSHKVINYEIQMRLIKELTSILHGFGAGKAFFTSDGIGPSWSKDVPPYALVGDGTYQDSHANPHFWSYGIFPNYRNTLWSCNWEALKYFEFTLFGVYAYNTPVVFTNGWGDDRGFSELTVKERSDFMQLFDYRKQFRTKLKALHSLPLYYGPEEK